MKVLVVAAANHVLLLHTQSPLIQEQKRRSPQPHMNSLLRALTPSINFLTLLKNFNQIFIPQKPISAAFDNYFGHLFPRCY